MSPQPVHEILHQDVDLRALQHLLLTALIPENCWERCIMRATSSCCLYTEEQIYRESKQSERRVE